MQILSRIRYLDKEEYPSFEELSNMIDSGAERCEATVKFDLNSPGSTVHAIEFLRNAMALGMRVSWRLILESDIELSNLYHITPPSSCNGDTSVVKKWAENYHYGSFFWRKGPDFVIIKDTRDENNSSQFVIDDPETLEAFYKCLTPQQLRNIDIVDNPIIEELVSEGVILKLGDWLLTLPYRIHSWPVPYDSI
ncbi:DUF5825 family protein [Alicyclobacillus ferrooxydans]|nr:DUF5825 family protein [Alicyclobacillus ferrooxydans]